MIAWRRSGGLVTLTARQWFPRPRDGVFSFFADAGNLEAITPPWLRFRILTPQPFPMCAGARIEYELRWRGIPLRWITDIEAWEPPSRFVDAQRVGPYRLWVHEHGFAERNGGTEVRDTVRYAVAGGPLVERLFVRRDLRRIFEYRARVLVQALGG